MHSHVLSVSCSMCPVSEIALFFIYVLPNAKLLIPYVANFVP